MPQIEGTAAKTLREDWYSAADPVAAYPSGVQAGELLLLYMHIKNQETSFTAAGWTLIGDTGGANDGFNTRLQVFGQIAAGGETGNIAMTQTGTQQNTESAVFRVSGASLSDVVFGHTGPFNGGGAPDQTIGNSPSVTTTVGGSLILRSIQGGVPATLPTATTEISQASSDVAISFRIAYENSVQASAGGTGAVAWAALAAPAIIHAHTLAIGPSGGAAVPLDGGGTESLTLADGTSASLAPATVTDVLQDSAGNVLANQTAIAWAWFDADPSTGATPADFGTGATTDGAGQIEVEVTTSLNVGQQGVLWARLSDGRICTSEPAVGF